MNIDTKIGAFIVIYTAALVLNVSRLGLDVINIFLQSCKSYWFLIVVKNKQGGPVVSWASVFGKLLQREKIHT